MRKAKSVIKVLFGLFVALCLIGCSGEKTAEITTETFEFIEIKSSSPTASNSSAITSATTFKNTSDTTTVKSTATAATTKATAKKTTSTVKKTTAEKTTAKAVSGGGMVWIPNSGSKYHTYAGCSNMKSPSHVSLSKAESIGYEPCKKCY